MKYTKNILSRVQSELQEEATSRPLTLEVDLSHFRATSSGVLKPLQERS